MIKAKCIELLKLDPNATDEQIIAALTAKLVPAEESEKKPEEPKPEPTAEEKLTAANEATARAVTAANEARVARVEASVTPLINSGKITLAEATTLKPKLIEAANEAEVTTLLEPFEKRNVTSASLMSDGLAGKRGDVIAANSREEAARQRTQAHHAVLKEITKGGAARPGDSDRAWTIASQRNPKLFAH